MTVLPGLAVARTEPPRSPRRLATTPARVVVRRLRDPVFWQVQAGVAAVSGVHYVIEARVRAEPYENLHWIPVILYVFPIIYASLRFGLEGGLLTGLWCAVLTTPNMLVWHTDNVEWLIEATLLSSGVVTGLVLSRLVEHEAAERRRAEGMAEHLQLLHEQVTRAQEDERLRIARELHDETAQSLILLCRNLDDLATSRRTPKAVAARLEEIRSRAEAVLTGVRRFSQDLRPPVLDDLGLPAAVEWLVSDLSRRKGIDAQVELRSAQRRLPPDTEVALFRIVQEALRNVERHAEASKVRVTLAFEGRGVSIGITDDGRGFEPPATLTDLVARGRLGLVGMRERALLLGGHLVIESRQGRGTTVYLRV